MKNKKMTLGTFQAKNKTILDLDLEIMDARNKGYEAYLEWDKQKNPIMVSITK